MDKKKILIVDDEKINLNILLGLLGDNYEISVALSGEKAFNIVKKKEINLILLDILMPNMNGYEVCKILKSRENTKDIPIIFITAKTDEEAIEKAYDIGGSDYVTKPFQPKELLARVKKELCIQDMMSELKLLACTDPMTKLYNRRHFTSISEHIFEFAKREKSELCLIMLDIDKFKCINDTFGHDIGDAVIISLADKLQNNCRSSDIVCRFGGEEFVILLPNTTIDNAKILSEKIRTDIENFIIEIDGNQNIQYTVSIGLSKIDLQSDKNIQVSLKRADEFLYEAKETGRNKLCFQVDT